MFTKNRKELKKIAICLTYAALTLQQAQAMDSLKSDECTLSQLKSRQEYLWEQLSQVEIIVEATPEDSTQRELALVNLNGIIDALQSLTRSEKELTKNLEKVQTENRRREELHVKAELVRNGVMIRLK